ncbi:ribosomal-processing cysteine protease Prp [Acetobacterium paludosum]|uniref:Ribosomal processing cysteine protease Prp n=2 Tax=Acetobacterium TaxID=33951 RepID=A0A923KXI6_9FIRM|nr:MULTISPECIES: ribosomal-processing cysteine protease Prp [Acetobacterium]MBC3797969.1 ribosomal-processing cysteine protease Prp [Acetobacterium tundrae]MBC3889640.1 ribosomal-processing cysteine protease Prp [Acetobacterium paludosum]
MISVNINGKNNEVDEVIVSGHSGFADQGEDIVCAAVSVLTISILNGLTEIVGRKDLSEMVEEGYVRFTIPKITDEKTKMKTETLISTLLLGIRGIKEAYGDYIQFEEVYK